MRSAFFGACILCAAAVVPSRAGAQAPSEPAAASPATASQSKAPAPDAVQRRYRRYQRVKRAGWTMTGVSFAGFLLTTIIYAKSCHCSKDAWLCFCDPVVGAALGALFFGPPFIAGIITGSIGTAHARRYLAEHPTLARIEIGVSRNGFALGYRF